MTVMGGRLVVLFVALLGALPVGLAPPLLAAAQPECVDSGSDALLVWSTAGALLAPSECVRIHDGGRVTWLNLDVLAPRDPGDGWKGQDASFCFQASLDGGRLGPGERFAADFFIEDATLVLRGITNNDVLVAAERACPETGVEIWHLDEAGHADLPWIDYLHPGSAAKRIVIDV